MGTVAFFAYGVAARAILSHERLTFIGEALLPSGRRTFVATFKEFPPRQKPSSFSVDQIMETLQSRKVAVPIEPVDRFKM